MSAEFSISRLDKFITCRAVNSARNVYENEENQHKNVSTMKMSCNSCLMSACVRSLIKKTRKTTP